MKNEYDYIVYGASFAGIVYAAKKSDEGYSVLLLNKYGFPGGSITESLNCLQKYPAADKGTVAGNILKRIEEENIFRFYKSDNEIIINPEVVKIVLQKEIEERKIDLLFHVIPKSVNSGNDKIRLTVIAKEGELSFVSNSAIDATSEYHLNFLNGQKREALRNNYFIFTTGSINENALSLEPVDEYRKLYDGRFWVKLKIAGTDPSFINAEAQETLDAFSKSLVNGRIQLVPAQTFINYKIEHSSKSSTNKILSAEEIIGREFEPEEEILKAIELEKKLKKNG